MLSGEREENVHRDNVFFHLFVTSNQSIIRHFTSTQLQSKSSVIVYLVGEGYCSDFDLFEEISRE